MAPPEGVWKVNCDASFSKSNGRSCVAYICRDRSGSIIHFNVKYFQCQSALHAEVLAVWEAVAFASNHQSQNFVIESDCLSAINLCSDHSEVWPWDCEVVGLEISGLVSLYNNVSFNHVRRIANHVADWLTKHPSALVLYDSVFNVHPGFLDILQKDLSV